MFWRCLHSIAFFHFLYNCFILLLHRRQISIWYECIPACFGINFVSGEIHWTRSRIYSDGRSRNRSWFMLTESHVTAGRNTAPTQGCSLTQTSVGSCSFCVEMLCFKISMAKVWHCESCRAWRGQVLFRKDGTNPNLCCKCLWTLLDTHSPFLQCGFLLGISPELKSCFWTLWVTASLSPGSAAVSSAWWRDAQEQLHRPIPLCYTTGKTDFFFLGCEL